ncbi:MAG: GAF domain-containing protein, partial [Acidobacteria bacterium]|nr:GAF domain-containing protein [Acidobacteriota bacterium]
MVQINYRDREITAKVVYYGPALSGKTTNLQKIHEYINYSQPTKFYSLNTKNDRTLFFDLLPMSLGQINDFNIKIQLYTVPGQVQYNSTRKVVLAGCDAIVFVADSQKAEAEANLFSLTNMKSNLRANGLLLEQTPWILQYNKRDLPNIMSIQEMNQSLNKNGDVKIFESVAPAGEGIFETFIDIVTMMIESILTKYRMIKTDKELIETQKKISDTLNNLMQQYEQGKAAAAAAPPAEEQKEESQETPEESENIYYAAYDPYSPSGTAVQVGEEDVDNLESTQPIDEKEEPVAEVYADIKPGDLNFSPTEQHDIIIPTPSQSAIPLDPAIMAQQQRQITTFQLGQSPSISEQKTPAEQEFLTNEQLVETAVQANMKITEITDKLTESESMLEQKVKELQHISEIGKALTSELYLDRLLEMIINAAVSHLDVKYASINLYDKEKNYMEPRQLYNLKDDPIVVILKDKLISFLRSITDKGKMAVITGSENKSLANALEKFDNYSSFICVSLKCKQGLLGVLNLYYKNDETYKKEDLRFVILLATYASIAVENALLYKDMNHATHFLNSIINNSSDGILKLSPTYRVLSFNSTASALLGYSESDIVGKNISSLVEKTEFSNVENIARQGFLGNTMRYQPCKFLKKDGKIFDTFITVSPIWNEENKILFTSVLIHNTGEQKIVVEKTDSKPITAGFILTLAAELEPQLSKAREQMAVAEQKLADAIKADSSSSFMHVKSAMEEVSRILDNSLKMQQIKAISPPSGEKLEEVDVNDLLMSIIYMRQSEFDTNGVSLDIPSNMPIVRYPQADLTQVFNNLISQSIKFTEGSVSSKISITASNESSCFNIYVKSRP